MFTDPLHTAISLLHHADYLVALTGAGLSTHSGIPDFRSPHSGLWETANSDEVASLHGFRRHPERFYNWIRPLAHTILAAAPNAAHIALAQMESHGKLKSVITQNIDMLHARAGSQRVHEVHGHLREMTCIHCFEVFPAEEYMLDFLQNGTLPRCPICDNVLKPNVILFGEQLPALAINNAQREARRCDVMLVAGSSLEVYPAAKLPLIARQSGASLILVNLSETPLDALAQVVIHGDVVDILPQLAASLENPYMSAQPPLHDPISLDSYRQLMARYERLMEISRQLNSTLDLGALLNRIVQAAVELTDTEEASILLLDPATGELRFEAASNLSGSAMAAIPVPIEGSLAGWVLTHGEPTLVEDARSDSRWFANVDKTIRFTTRNLLAVPMRVHNQVIGVVEAINKRDDHPWTQDNVNTLAILADQAAIAVQNARLFQQSDFIAEMVHELRTPLAALRASATLLLRPNFPETQRQEIILTMQQETERLSSMTTDFLDLARLESGRTRLEIRKFDVRDLLLECVGLVENQAAEHQITISVQAESMLAEADRDKVRQVILNLLTNAIKYNRDGGQIICACTQRDESAGCAECCLLISVQDTGYGISEEDQKYVFEKFYRVADTAGYTTGTGLGLSIARRIIEAHGCEMWLESQLDVGTTFYVSLPIAHQRRDQVPPGSAELSSPRND